MITSFLSTLIGQPHFGAEGPRNASIVTRRPIPYVGGAAGHETRFSSYHRCLLFVASNYVSMHSGSHHNVFCTSLTLGAHARGLR